MSLAEGSPRPSTVTQIFTPRTKIRIASSPPLARGTRTQPELDFPGSGCLLSRAARSLPGQDGGGGGPMSAREQGRPGGRASSQSNRQRRA